MYLSLYRPRPVLPVSDVAFGDVLNRVFGAVAANNELVSNGAQKTRHPRFDLIEKADHFEASIDLPGVAKEDIAIEIEGAIVSVSAEIKDAPQLGEGERVLHNERYVARFARRIELPSEVVDASASASFENGVLKLVLPKKEVTKAKRISIQ